jgi:hypothetical protein
VTKQSHRQRKISKKHDIVSLGYVEIAALILLIGRISFRQTKGGQAQ